MSEKRGKKRKPVLERAKEAPRYEFTDLVENNQELKRYATGSSNRGVRLDLSSREATYALTRAILRDHFDLCLTLPPGQLVPTVPNRVQYLTWAAELLPNGLREEPTVLDLGTGPSCIYALLGTRLYPKWFFIATDTDPIAIDWARRNVEANDLRKIKVLHTLSEGKLLPPEVVAAQPSLTVCNPPFHSELPDTTAPAGSQNQLVTQGGEYSFLCRLAEESTQTVSVDWFTSLVGRKVDLPRIVAYLRSPRIRAPYVRTVELSQGGRTTRWAVAWSFGQEESIVTLIDDHGSKWRLIFSVRPGRQFANQLCANDIAATFSSVLHDLQWRKEYELAKGDNCDAALRGPKESSLSQTAIQLHVTEGAASGEFRVYLKVKDRGELMTSEFADLGNKVTQAVLDLLNHTGEC